MTKSKAADPAKGYRNRQGETLFIDARNLGTMINRTTKELTADDIATIADTYHAWRSTPEELDERVKRGDSKLAQYEDRAGFCKVATIAEIKANDYVLTPGRFVGAAEQEDDGVAFETKMRELSQTLFAQMKQAQELDKAIRQNLEVLGYGEVETGTVADVCTSIVDCVNKTAPVVEYPTDYKMIRTPNIRAGKVTLDGCRYVEKEVYETWTRRSKPQKGDVTYFVKLLLERLEL